MSVSMLIFYARMCTKIEISVFLKWNTFSCDRIADQNG